MNHNTLTLRAGCAITLLAATGIGASVANAVSPCGDYGECKTLIEINSTDGDIGFHFLVDGDDLSYTLLRDPNGKLLFGYKVGGPLRDQFLTETFAESAEPLCWPDPDADPDDTIVTLAQFLDRWTPGTYVFSSKSGDGRLSGESQLSFDLPAAPANLDYDEASGIVSWSPGDDLGRCATSAELAAMVTTGDLPAHPQFVPVAHWEVVFEPDVDGPTGKQKYAVRVPPGQLSVTVPADYLASLPADTPAKIEVGAIGLDDNATFTEEDGICVNEDDGCGDDDGEGGMTRPVTRGR